MSSRRASSVLRFLLVFYFLEAGFVLVIFPWNRRWMDRVVLRSPVAARNVLQDPFFRGFLAGVGLLHVAFAVRELEAWRRDILRRLSTGG